MSKGLDILASSEDQDGSSKFDPQLDSRNFWGKIFAYFCVFSAFLGLAVLAFLIFDVISDGSSRLNGGLFSQFPSRRAEASGYRAAIWGSIWMLSYVLLLVVPIGVSTAIYLEEYAPKKLVYRNN